MKTLQNDLTTIEQSKRLLELGVPKDSANHYYGKDGKLHYIDGTIPYSLLWETGCTPCWSVGRLIEIYKICNPADSLLEAVHLGLNFDLITILMTSFEAAIGVGCMDFSKLEE